MERGRFFTLLGPSGCGKTTTLRCVAGVEQPDEGEIAIDGRLVFSRSRRVQGGNVSHRCLVLPLENGRAAARGVASYRLAPRRTSQDEVLQRAVGGIQIQLPRERVDTGYAVFVLGRGVGARVGLMLIRNASHPAAAF